MDGEIGARGGVASEKELVIFAIDGEEVLIKVVDASSLSRSLFADAQSQRRSL